MKMTSFFCLGNRGDEGKGKLVDLLAEKADVVARCQGGNNAGHTVVANSVSYAFHLLPSGLVHPNAKAVLGRFPLDLGCTKRHGIAD